MKVRIIGNGTIKVILIPENDFDKHALTQMSNQEIESTLINQKFHLLDEEIPEGLILKNKNKTT